MKKDYSEFQLSEYDRYQIRRSNREDVTLDFFYNTVRFAPEDRSFVIRVDDGNEYHTMQEYIDEYNEDQCKRFGYKANPPSEEEEQEDREFREAGIARNQRYRSAMEQKYKVDFKDDPEDLEHEPLLNIFSGSRVELNYGEGILDFVYADFDTPLRSTLKAHRMLAALGIVHRRKQPEADAQVQKVYTQAQEFTEDFYAYECSFNAVRETAYASLYSAICPPKFDGIPASEKELLWYGDYLKALQKEYLDLIEFCFDDTFYPDALGNLYPSERFSLYRYFHDLPTTTRRTETVSVSVYPTDRWVMPYGMPPEEFVRRLQNVPKPTADHVALAEKLGIATDKLVAAIAVPHFLNVQYQFGAVAEILELEFTKMLEANVRFRKCKRCGKYFIMKGNYDTNYCERVAEGETRNCQELAAAENYKAKIAGDKAIPIYNKYYKRYAARVRVKQIREADFKKWKYQAITLRNECSAGKITVEEYIQWMEDSFPNRKPKT